MALLDLGDKKQSHRHSTTCAHCGRPLVYEDGETSVQCFACDGFTDVTKAQDPQNKAGQDGQLSGLAGAAIRNMKNPETGIRYLRALATSYDFSFIQDNPHAIDIPEIADTVAELKLTNGEDPKAWLFSMEATALPIRKKIAYLATLEERMAKSYEDKDESVLYADFDTLRASVSFLKGEKDNILRGLEADLKEVTELSKGEEAKAGKEIVAEIKAGIEGLKEYETPFECPKVKTIFDRVNAEIAKALAENGIAAEEEYQAAMAAIKEGDRFAALKKLQFLGDYKDSAKYRAQCNVYSVVKNMLTVDGKHYQLSDERVRIDAAPGKKGCAKAMKKGTQQEQQPEQPTEHAMMIRALINGEPDLKGEPLVKNVRKTITAYGPYYYFISWDDKLHFRDLRNTADVILDANGNYHLDTFHEDKNKMVDYFLQRRPKNEVPEKKGCRGAAKKGNPIVDPFEAFNQLRLVRLDLAKGDNAFSPLIPEIDRIAYWKGDYVGYWKTVKDPQEKKGCRLGKRPEPKFHKEYHLFRLSTGEAKQILKYDDEIVFTEGSKIYYTRFLETKYNLALYVIDFDSGESKLLVENIYSAVMVNAGKVYYTIGNTYKKTLFALDLATGEKQEIMSHFNGFADCFGGYFYLYRGYGRNRALIKRKIDGTGEPIVLAVGMDENMPSFFKNGYFFYMKENPFSHFDGMELHKVRVDGQNDTVLDYEVRKVLHVGEKRIYFSVSEYVDEVYAGIGGTKDVRGISLYSFDTLGGDLKKDIFDVDALEIVDDETLYYCHSEHAAFKYTYKKRESQISRIVDHYYSYNMENGATEQVMLAGYPHGNEKVGCFRKKDVQIEYEQIPERKPYHKEELK